MAERRLAAVLLVAGGVEEDGRYVSGIDLPRQHGETITVEPKWLIWHLAS